MVTISDLLSAPAVLWHLYIDYLWRVEPGSWIAWIASCFRALAFAFIAPFAILTMLDIASYVIARTLGVIDVTKAATGGAHRHGSGEHAGAESESDAVAMQIQLNSSDISDANNAGPSGELSDASSFSISTPAYFKETVVEESDMKLSGAGAFSPFPSQPPSPSLSRRDLSGLGGATQLQPMTGITGTEKKGRKRSDTGSSTHSRGSGESQFTMVNIDRESGEEESGEGGVQIRRRRQGGDRDGVDS